MYTEEGILLSCNKDGVIEKIHFNRLGIPAELITGKLFINLFKDDYISKSLDFFQQIKASSASFGWELFLKEEFGEEVHYFGGGITGEDITIFGSKSNVNVAKFLNGMMYINNEQINRIRELEKATRDNKQTGANLNEILFEDLMRLNNELVDLQREVIRKNRELIELNNLKNQFLGIAAHDLRNPLGHILNYLELMQEDELLKDTEHSYTLNQIQTMSTFMLGLINDLLDYSTIESGTISLLPEPIDLVALLKRTIELNKDYAKKKNIEIRFTAAFLTYSIIADYSKIMQIAQNILSNAIKYSPADASVDVAFYDEENSVVFFVQDEGPGMSKEESDNLFKPFQKGSAPGTAGETKTGLGLYICKRIADAHHGEIWIESSPGAGASFYVRLPKPRSFAH